MSICTEQHDPRKTRAALGGVERLAGEQRESWVQALVLELEGITAGDYLAWVRDPEPPALGRELRSVSVDADPLGDRIDVELVWDRPPSAVRGAAASAGFLPTPEVISIRPA